MDWSGGSRVSFLQTQLFPVCQTLAAKGTSSTIILTKMRVDIITMKRAFICIQQQADFVVNDTKKYKSTHYKIDRCRIMKGSITHCSVFAV